MKSSYAQKTGHDRVLTSDEDLGMLEEKKGKRLFEGSRRKREEKAGTAKG